MFITTRVEQGLPFVANELTKLIILSTIAKAQDLYHVQICHFLLMSNHIHLLMTFRSPDDVAGFMNYFKTETAHAVNRLQGLRNRTVWADGYSALSILTLDDTIEKIAYTYCNPQKANLVESIEQYPGVSSWQMFTENNLSEPLPRIARSSIYSGCTVQSLTDESHGKTVDVTISPNSWMRLFGVRQEGWDDINSRIIRRVRALEAEHSAERVRVNRPVLGTERLQTQSIDTPYTPSKFARQMWCICRDVEFRISFIQSVKIIISKAREVYSRWRQGDRTVPYPAGMFAPRFPRLFNRYVPVPA